MMAYCSTLRQPHSQALASPCTSGATFILIHKMQENAEMAKEVLKFFDWAYTNGNKLAADLDYVPLPENVQNLIRKAWKDQIRDTSGAPLTK